MDECYCLNFIEAGGKSGFTCHGVCLCGLGRAAEVWLKGGSMEDVVSVMTKKGDHSHEH